MRGVTRGAHLWVRTALRRAAQGWARGRLRGAAGRTGSCQQLALLGPSGTHEVRDGNTRAGLEARAGFGPSQCLHGSWQTAGRRRCAARWRARARRASILCSRTLGSCTFRQQWLRKSVLLAPLAASRRAFCTSRKALKASWFGAPSTSPPPWPGRLPSFEPAAQRPSRPTRPSRSASAGAACAPVACAPAASSSALALAGATLAATIPRRAARPPVTATSRAWRPALRDVTPHQLPRAAEESPASHFVPDFPSHR